MNLPLRSWFMDVSESSVSAAMTRNAALHSYSTASASAAAEDLRRERADPGRDMAAAVAEGRRWLPRPRLGSTTRDCNASKVHGLRIMGREGREARLCSTTPDCNTRELHKRSGRGWREGLGS